ncbi:hypothetical protein KKD88_00605 [Patescibacteria group bacterium]|nr:hypothetical protein [Patescibacteria group bacterium]
MELQMSENTTKSQINPNAEKDVIMEVMTIWVKPDQIADFIMNKGLTAAQVVKIEVDTDTGKIGLGITAAGLDIRTKSMFKVGFEGGDYIANIVILGNLLFTEETPNIGTYRQLDDAIEMLSCLPDAKTDLPVTDLYTTTPLMNGRLVTMMRIPEKEERMVLNPVGRHGIASIRYDKSADILLAVFVDPTGTGFAIGAINAAEVRSKPERISTGVPWTLVARQTDNRSLGSLGRPKTGKADEIKIVVNLEGGYERLLTIKRTDRNRFSGIWGEEQKTQNFGIGFLSGSDDVYASYRQFERIAELHYDTALQMHPVAKSYLKF